MKTIIKLASIFSLALLTITSFSQPCTDNQKEDQTVKLLAPEVTATIQVNITDCPPDCPAKDCKLIIVVVACDNNCYNCHPTSYYADFDPATCTYYIQYTTTAPYVRVVFANKPGYTCNSFNSTPSGCTSSSSPSPQSLSVCAP